MRNLILIISSAIALGSLLTAHGATPAADCSLLSPAQIQQVMGQPFGEPSKTQALPAFAKQAPGSECHYSSQKGHASVDFIVYVDGSPSEAKQTFERLSMWYPAKSKPSGIGDSAYIDSGNSIHVLKGKVRYFISLSPRSETQLKDLAVSVATRI